MSDVTIPDARDQLRGVIAERLQIFGHEPTVEQANAFLAGFDVAWGHALLRDYHEWLVVKVGGGYNVHWFALARNLAMGIGPYDAPPADHREDHESEIGTRVLESVIEFLDEVDRLDGRRDLYARYEAQRAADGLG